MPTRIVTISHAWGSGGEAVGRAVADRLGFRYVNEEVITLVADKHGLEATVVADAERRRTFLERIAEDVATPLINGMSGVLVANAHELGRRAEMRSLIVEAIRDIADRGSAVIVAHAASIPLAGRSDLLRVLITASEETRIQRLAEGTGGDAASARRFMEDSDAARADYFERFYQIERELPTYYDVTLNMDALSVDDAVDIIVTAARRRP
jgi:cytidylate kinase